MHIGDPNSQSNQWVNLLHYFQVSPCSVGEIGNILVCLIILGTPAILSNALAFKYMYRYVRILINLKRGAWHLEDQGIQGPPQELL